MHFCIYQHYETAIGCDQNFRPSRGGLISPINCHKSLTFLVVTQEVAVAINFILKEFIDISGNHMSTNDYKLWFLLALYITFTSLQMIFVSKQVICLARDKF